MRGLQKVSCKRKNAGGKLNLPNLTVTVDGMKNKNCQILKVSVIGLGGLFEDVLSQIYKMLLHARCIQDGLYAKCNRSIKFIAHINRIAINISHKCTCPQFTRL